MRKAPQHSGVPSACSAQVCERPAAIRATFESAALPIITCTGLERSVVVPSPSWPETLRPQHHNVPSVLRAQKLEWFCPSRSTDDSPPTTWTGVEESLVLPLPSWPQALWPQHQTVRSLRRAHDVVRAHATSSP